MTVKKLFPLLFVALALVGCPKPQPQPQHPETPVDCATACAAASDMHCSIGERTKGGGECIDVCRNADDNGFPWNVACMTSAKTCAVLESCS
jgi:hypothetical protein